MLNDSFIRYLLILMMIVLVSCGKNKKQNEFERSAFRDPEGYTETNVNGQILSIDSDDWRISPLFETYLTIDRPIFPNPVQPGKLTIDFLIESLDAINGLDILIRTIDGNLISIHRYLTSPLPPGLISISLDSSIFDTRYDIYRIDGLTRLFIYDNRRNLITYGDLKLE